MTTETEIEAAAIEARELIAVIANDEHYARAETLIDQLEDAALDRVRDIARAEAAEARRADSVKRFYR